MNGAVRRTFEMVARVVNFSDAQPDTDAGHAVSVERLKQLKAQMEQVALRATELLAAPADARGRGARLARERPAVRQLPRRQVEERGHAVGVLEVDGDGAAAARQHAGEQIGGPPQPREGARRQHQPEDQGL